MNTQNRLKRLSTIAIAGCLALATTTYAQGEKMTSEVYESGYTTSLPLKNGGEAIDLLVRVSDSGRGYDFNLVFVEESNWPHEKKLQLYRLYEGRLITEKKIIPFPVKLKFRLEATDGSGFSVERIFSDRKPLYLTRYVDGDKAIWRAHQIYGSVLKPGVYRLRIENMQPAPALDFETRFEFKRDGRKY